MWIPIEIYLTDRSGILKRPRKGTFGLSAREELAQDFSP